MDISISSIGPIMKAARKFKKFNQADVAGAIGCSQSALSKMEHGLLIPSAPQWFLFSRFTSIPPESLESGIIDRQTEVQMNNEEVSLGFKIPKRYRSFRAEKVRELYPLFTTYEKLGKEFVQYAGIDSEFYLDFDNLINYQLFIDAVSFYVSHGIQSSSEIKKIVKMGQDKIYWDDYDIEWRNLHSIEDVLRQFIKAQKFFQADFILKAETNGKTLKFTYTPANHAQVFAKDFSSEASDFIRLYRKYTLESLIQLSLGVEIVAKVVNDDTLSPLGDSFEIAC